jgi:2-polyprenyl-3-methyl-5-hydroxy-6-metoxy-1,4-benzoquinol methylase
MIIKNSLCRACNKRVYTEPILIFENSPRSAQGFLNEENLGNDSPIDIPITQCRSCGVIQHPLEPVEYYREVVRSVAFSSDMHQFRLTQLQNWLLRYRIKRKSIIEIGSGRGEYLKLLKEAGAENVSGVEYSEIAVKACIDDKLNVYQGYLDGSFEISSGEKFDAFTIFSFLEHWPNPELSLSNLHELLNDGAVGLVEVPNFEMILEKGLLCEFTVDHIFYFDQNTISRLLEQNGFAIKKVDKIWNDYILSIEIVKKGRANVGVFNDTKERVAREIITFLDRCPGEVAVWGAGHQALAIITLSEIYKRISFIVDSATFKQYKYTPATHLKIYPPDYLKEKNLSGIIIMAAGYSSEIYSSVISKYCNIKNIAILREDHLEIMKIE